MYPTSYYRSQPQAGGFAGMQGASVQYNTWTSHLDPNRFVWQAPEAGPPVSNDQELVHKIEHYINSYPGFPAGMRFLVILEHAGERSPIHGQDFNEILEENQRRGLKTGVIMLNTAGSVRFKTYDTDGKNTIPEVCPWRFHLKIRLPTDGISTRLIYSGLTPLETPGMEPRAIESSSHEVQAKTSLPPHIAPMPSPIPQAAPKTPYNFTASNVQPAAAPYSKSQGEKNSAPASMPTPQATFTRYNTWTSQLDPNRFVWQAPEAGPPVSNDQELVHKIEHYINSYPGFPAGMRFLVLLEHAGGRSPIHGKDFKEILEENQRRGLKTGVIMLNTAGSVRFKTYVTDGRNTIPEVRPWRFHLKIRLPNDGISTRLIYSGLTPLETPGVDPRAIEN